LKQKQTPKQMTTLDNIIEMLKNIDSMLNRTMQKDSLSYDKNTLAEIIKKGYVSVKGKYVTREFHGKNYEVYA
jgi:hypothetical protein